MNTKDILYPSSMNQSDMLDVLPNNSWTPNPTLCAVGILFARLGVVVWGVAVTVFFHFIFCQSFLTLHFNFVVLKYVCLF